MSRRHLFEIDVTRSPDPHMPSTPAMHVSVAEEMGRQFLAGQVADHLDATLVAIVTYRDVIDAEQRVTVEVPPLSPALGDMHLVRAAIVAEGGSATLLEIAMRMQWSQTTPTGYRSYGIERARTACLAGVDHGLIGTLGDPLYIVAETGS